MTEALYSLYRPKTFSDVIGQEHITQTLSGALKAGKESHAYLFSGPRGTGKTTCARILAASVNCLNSNVACGECESCVAIQNGSHSDVVEMDAASNRGINDIRELRSRVTYQPVWGKRKVYILDETHMLTTEASNALLKTLEEPPAHVIFILATTEIHKMLSTIRSRCQPFTFRLVDNKSIFGRLDKINQEQNLKVPNLTLEYIVTEAKGSVRDAISLLDLISGLENRDVDRVRYLMGRMNYQQVGDFVSCLGERNAAKAIRFINQAYQDSVDMYLLKQDVIAWLRGVVHVASGANFSHPMLNRMRDQALDFKVSDLVVCLNKFNSETTTCPFLPQLTMELPAIDAITAMQPAEDF